MHLNFLAQGSCFERGIQHPACCESTEKNLRGCGAGRGKYGVLPIWIYWLLNHPKLLYHPNPPTLHHSQQIL